MNFVQKKQKMIVLIVFDMMELSYKTDWTGWVFLTSLDKYMFDWLVFLSKKKV